MGFFKEKKFIRSIYFLDFSYLVFAIALFAPVVFSDQRFIIRDLMHFYLPAGMNLGNVLLGEGSLLWDNTICHGLPLLARLSQSVCYPPLWLFALFSGDRAMTVLVIGHMVLAAMCVLRVTLRFTSNQHAAWMGGLAYGFGGYMMSLIGGGTYLFGAGLLPLAVLSMLRLSEQQNLFRILELGLVLALQICVGEPTLLFYEILFIAPLIMLYKVDTIRGLGKRIGMMTLSGVIALLLAGCQLWPLLEFAELSVRANGVPWNEAASWSFHPIRTVEFVLPYLFGSIGEENFFWARSLITGSHNVPWAPAVYLGLFTFVGLFFLEFGKKPIVAIGCLVVFFLAMSFGSHTPIFRAVYEYLPGANRFRYPEKFLLFVALGFSVLGAVGLGRFFKSLPLLDSGAARKRTIGSIAALSLVAIAAITARWLFDPDSPRRVKWFAELVASEQANIDATKSLAALADALSSTIGVAIVLLIALVCAWKGLLRRRLEIGVFIAAGVLNLFVSALPVRGIDSAGWLMKEPALCAALPQSASGRKPFVYRTRGLSKYQEDPGISRSGTRFERQRHWEWNTLKANVGAPYCAHYVDGYEVAITKRWTQFRELLFEVELSRALSILGIEYVLARRGELGSVPYPIVAEFSQLDVAVHQTNGVVPFLHASGVASTVSELESAVRKMGTADYSPLKEIVFETEIILPMEPPARRKAVLRDYAPGRIEIQTDFQHAGYLMVLETLYPGWKATIDGQGIHLYYANGVFMGLKVPSGKKRILLEFAPPRQKMGNILTLSSIVLCLVLIIVAVIRKT